MAATISINFASPEELFSVQPPTKKSVSAKLFVDTLGGITGGGYVKRTGDYMTGTLSLTATPVDPRHVVTKSYVDQHSFTRRYYFSTGVSLQAGQTVIFGRDDYDQTLYFFDAQDVTSIDVIQRYVDVYRNGILQVYGSDYYFSNLYQEQTGILSVIFPHKLHFNSPLLSGTNVQVHVGNKGSMPSIVGVVSLSGRVGSGIRIGNYYGNNINTGDLSVSAYPLDFIATTAQVRDPKRNDLCLSPMNLSAFPLVAKAWAHYRKTPGWTREFFDDKYGNLDGYFKFVRGYNLGGLQSGAGTDTPETFTCKISGGVFPTAPAPGDYNPMVTVTVASATDIDQYAAAIVFNNTKLHNEFKFGIMDFTYSAPIDVDEFTVVIY